MEANMLILMSIVMAIGIFGMLAVGMISVSQEAEARGCESGPAGSVAFNASQGRCFGH